MKERNNDIHGSAEKAQSRREFVKVGMRWGFLGVLGVLGAVLGARSVNGEDCYYTIPCNGCRAFEFCRLPKASNFKSGNPLTNR
ncbi:MAG: hypothetical protein K9N52_01945 [Verrucomicrobia bacterium]|nr:hypothetical protein [Verrucomicrobiota bacterium]